MGSCVSTLHSVERDLSAVSDYALPVLGPISESRVPDDVLHQVFVFVALAEKIRGVHDKSLYTPGAKNPTYLQCLGWMRLSAVCRRWRAVLLTAAQIWSDVVFDLPERASMLALSRSGQASLEMVVPFIVPTTNFKSSKSWGSSHTHRERLLKLAISQAPRMRTFVAADLTAREYRDIFSSRTYDTLHYLMLRYHYRDSNGEETPAPTHEDIGHLRISAPSASVVDLSMTLPFAYDDEPGLSLYLPGLRRLNLTVPDHDIVTLAPRQLSWIPDLIRGAPRLSHFLIYLPTGSAIDWTQLCGEEPFQLPTLRYVQLSGTPNARLDRLYSGMSAGASVPWTWYQSIHHMSRPDTFEVLSAYGEIVGRLLGSHSLDTARISRGWRGDHGAMFSFSAFSSKGLPGAYTHLDALILHDAYEDIDGLAGLELHFSRQIMEEDGGGDETLEDAITMLAPYLAQNTFQELILDEIYTPGWAAALNRLMHLCLSDVTTLHCLETRRAFGFPTTLLPCTAALRALAHSYGTDAQSQIHALPALHTIIVSMWVARRKEKDTLWTMCNGSAADVREWWEELIEALEYRRNAGLRVRTVRIIGGWTSQKLHDRTAKMDGMCWRARLN